MNLGMPVPHAAVWPLFLCSSCIERESSLWKVTMTYSYKDVRDLKAQIKTMESNNFFKHCVQEEENETISHHTTAAGYPKADIYSLCLKCIHVCKVKGLGELVACPKYKKLPRVKK